MTMQMESAQADLVALGRFEKMMKQTTCYGCDEPNEPDYWMIRGEIWSDDIAFLEAHNGTSSEVQAAMEEWENNAVPLYKSPVTTDKLSVEKLQEQLNTAKKYIEHVIGTIKHDGHLGTIQTDWILPNLEKALAVIGGDDDRE